MISILFSSFDSNKLGVMHMTQVAIDHMARENGGDGGVIANIASVCGLDYIFSVPAYSASKHGVVGFTRTLAVCFISFSVSITDIHWLSSKCARFFFKTIEKAAKLIAPPLGQICFETILLALRNDMGLSVLECLSLRYTVKNVHLKMLGHALLCSSATDL